MAVYAFTMKQKLNNLIVLYILPYTNQTLTASSLIANVFYFFRLENTSLIVFLAQRIYFFALQITSSSNEHQQ